MTLVRWKPASRTLEPFSNWIEDFFSNDFGNLLGNDWFNTVPAVNIVETGNEYRVEVAAPGLKKNDFKIHVEKGLLTISSEKEEKHEEKDEKFTRREFSYTSFNRSFNLPDSVNSDKIKAEYDQGMLTVHLPKKEEAKDKPAIEIKVS